MKQNTDSVRQHRKASAAKPAPPARSEQSSRDREASTCPDFQKVPTADGDQEPSGAPRLSRGAGG